MSLPHASRRRFLTGAAALGGRAGRPRARGRRDRAGGDRRHRPADRRVLAPRSGADAHWFARIRQRPGADLVLSRVRRLVGAAARRRRRAFTSLSDKGEWFTGRLVTRGKDLVGLEEVQAAPFLGADGRPVAARGLVRHRIPRLEDRPPMSASSASISIVRFDFAKNGVRARGGRSRCRRRSRPVAEQQRPRSPGVRAERLQLGGTLIAFSERGLDAAGNLKAFLIGGPSPGVSRSSAATISTSATPPCCRPATLLLLERRFSLLLDGIAMRHAPARARHDRAGRRGRRAGPSYADMDQQIDNMEGLDVHRTRDGRHHPDHGLGRQFLVPAADGGAAVQARSRNEGALAPAESPVGWAKARSGVPTP